MQCDRKFRTGPDLWAYVAVRALLILLLSSPVAHAQSTTEDWEPRGEQRFTHYSVSSPVGAVVRPDFGKVRLCQSLFDRDYSSLVCNVTTAVWAVNWGGDEIPDLTIETFLLVTDDEDGEVIERSSATEGECRFRDRSDERCEAVLLGQLSRGVVEGQSNAACTTVEASGPLVEFVPISVQMSISCDDHAPPSGGVHWNDSP